MTSVLQQKVKVIAAFCEEKNITVTLLVLIFTTVVIVWKRRNHIVSLMESLAQATGELTTDFKHRMLGRWAPRNVEQEERVIKRGGYVGGLVNDGNTCFMNSVLQSLASSKHLLKFLDEEILDAIEAIDEDETNSDALLEEENEDHAEKLSVKRRNGKVYGKQASKMTKAALSDKKVSKPHVDFTVCLKELLDTLNAKHYRNKPYFKTKRLLKTMSKAPNKNIILGYDQEDAQEFFQTLLSEIEKDHQSVHGKPPKGAPESVPANVLDEGAIIGSEHLDRIGTVYIPTDQIDPNSVLNDPAKHFTPFRLVTPLDGITAERIGCLQCGENGGIRYSLFSGLSLNLPNDNIGSTLKLTELLRNWIKPEIIEDVECNRCALMAVHEHLKTKFDQMKDQQGANGAPSKLCSLMKTRIERLEEILAKPVIDDEDYKKLHTENMIRKCSKSKQILIARPPPLLSIHINRSVFDPRTFMIRKNNSRVLFKTRLNLTPWCCDINEVNLDARLPMSKKNMGDCVNESSESEPYKAEYYSRLHRRFQAEFEDSEELEEEEDEEEEIKQGHYSNRNVYNYDPLNGKFSPSDHEEETDMHLEVDALGNTIVKPDPPSVDDVPSEDDIERSTDGDILEKPDNDDEEASDDADADEEEDFKEYPSHGRDEEGGMLPPLPEPANELVLSSVPASPLTYSLRSVVVHYGSHNYGHYIAFRKFRGVWWRISDETVYIVDEAEVLSTPGVFMLFYEYDYSDAAGQLNDDLEYADDSPSGSEMKDEFESLTGSTKTSIQDELLQE